MVAESLLELSELLDPLVPLDPEVEPDESMGVRAGDKAWPAVNWCWKIAAAAIVFNPFAG